MTPPAVISMPLSTLDNMQMELEWRILDLLDQIWEIREYLEDIREVLEYDPSPAPPHEFDPLQTL